MTTTLIKASPTLGRASLGRKIIERRPRCRRWFFVRFGRFVRFFERINGFQAHRPYVTANNRLRARYRLTNPQATNTRWVLP